MERLTQIEDLRTEEERIWWNPHLEPVDPAFVMHGYKFIHVKAAQNRFMRFMPYIAKAFPETAAKKGVIESPLILIPAMQEWMNEGGAQIRGKVFLKDDARLPIAGSVKARGGIHEVLRIAEVLGQKADLLHPLDNYEKIDAEEFRRLYGQYRIQVGSTGNLGIAIGRMASRLGFQTVVHMSQDAKEWKKDLLRSEGVLVKEYDGDYGQAVAAGRRESESEEKSFFIDDENSQDLFFGYATAALRVSVQLRKLGIPVDLRHPLFVYLPCGVGGAPGGITFGLKQLFGDAVHCFFAEPVQAPCFLLGMAGGKHEACSIRDLGLRGQTAADGLAVASPSAFACTMMETLMSGAFTVTDDHMALYQARLRTLEGVRLELSACAGFAGLSEACRPGSAWEDYLAAHGLEPYMENAVHIVWGTGGGLMPQEDDFAEKK